MCGSNNHAHALPPNTLDVTILPDGRIRIETGSFRGALHTSADRFLQALLDELGITVSTTTAITVVAQGTRSVILVGNGSGGK